MPPTSFRTPGMRARRSCSARLGFKALATTSSGFAFTLGRRDENVSLDEVVDARRAWSTRRPSCRSRSTSSAVTGTTPADAALAIARAAAAGAAGGSIEDYDPAAVHRRHRPRRGAVAEAAEAAHALDEPLVLTGARRESHPRRRRSRRHDRPPERLPRRGRGRRLRAGADPIGRHREGRCGSASR